MDPATIALLASTVMREIADIQDRNAAGTITQADIDKMLALLDHTVDSWDAKVKAHQKLI